MRSSFGAANDGFDLSAARGCETNKHFGPSDIDSRAIVCSASSARRAIASYPTSGIGRATAMELAKHGTVVLVGRDPRKLNEVQKAIKQKGQHAVSVVCNLSEVASVREAAAEIVALNLRMAGLLNNAGIMPTRATKNALGWDMVSATNHLGPFALTDALVPHLPGGATVVFVVSAVEDPERKIAVSAGFRGGRYISAEASAAGNWKPGGSEKPGYDAYATSKQALLAAAMAFARETPRVHFNAIEPGLILTTGLGRDAPVAVRILVAGVAPAVVPLLIPFMPFLSTPRRAARVITKTLFNESGQTGVYFDQAGDPMVGSELVRDPKFQDRVAAESRALLSMVPA